MSEDGPPESGEVRTWSGARDRIVRFARNLFVFERTMDRLVNNHAKQQTLLSDLNERVRRIEAQQEIIIRLLERGRRD